MQVTETNAEGLKREYAINIPAGEISAKIDEKLEAVRSDFAMKGFRKGKAPLSLMRKMFGKSMTGEALQEMVDGAVSGLLEDKSHRPAMQPKVEIVNDNYEEGQDLDVTIGYELLPDVPEVDFSGVTLERLTVAVDDAAVDETLTRLAETAVDYEAKDGAAEDKDQVVMDFAGSVDGEAFEGGSAEDFPLVLGSGQFIPGFEEQLIGVSAGDQKDVNVTFPEEYGAAHLAGKAAVFAVTIKEVKASKPAEIDDELAKKYGAESLAQLRERVGERVKGEYDQNARAYLKRKLLDQLDGLAKFDLPPSMVENEAKQIAHQLWHEDNPEVEGHDHPEVEATDEHTQIAERRVRLGLLLADVGSRNEIQVSEEELNSAIFQQAQQYPGQEREFFEFVRQNSNALQQIQAPLFEDKVVDFILELAKVEDKPVSKDELDAALKSLDDDDNI